MLLFTFMKKQETIKNKLEKYKDLEKCIEDPCYFIKNYVYIQHPKKGRIPLKLFPFQEECIQAFLQYRKNIIVKGRQLGLSTTTSAFCLWMALFHKDKNILFMATKLETAKNMVAKIRIMLKELPKWMLEMLNLQEMEADSVRVLKLSNGSKIHAIPTAPDAGRSEAVSFLVIDEAAHIDDLEELWVGLNSVLAEGGSCAVFSSPKGKNYFYEMYNGAETGEYKDGMVGIHCETEGPNGLHAIKLPWTVHPERDEEWYKKETKPMSERAIKQELLCVFEGSDNTYFDQNTIDWCKSIISEPIGQSGPKGIGTDLWVWKAPETNKEYKIFADVSRGDAADYSAFHVVDIKDSEIVAEFFGKIPPDRYGDFLVEVGKSYNYAQIIQEKNSVGIATAIKLRDLEYPNLYFEGEDTAMAQFVEESKMPGATTTQKNREELLSKLEDAMRNRRIKVNSSRFVAQMENFVWTGKRGQAVGKNSDDLIMALAVGFNVWTPVDPEVAIAKQNAGLSAWHQAFLKSVKRSGPYEPNIPHNPINGIGNNNTKNNSPQPGASFPIPNSRTYKGIPLKLGVSKEAVSSYDKMMREFDWVWKK